MANAGTISFSSYQFVGQHQTVTPTSSSPIVIPAGANAILMQAVGQNARVKFDGAQPSPTSGFQIRAGDPPVLFVGHEGQFFYVITEASGGTFEWIGVSQPN
jgi:hypothetical protein